MFPNDEATWRRLELQCLLTLMQLKKPGGDLRARAEDVAQDQQVSATYLSNTFGGTVSAPASAIAVGAIGNALAKANMPTTAGVIPVYSSADCI